MTLEGFAGSDGIGAAGEGGDGALFIVLKNLEILGGEIADVVALFVDDDGVHADREGFRANDLLGTGRLSGGRRAIPRWRHL